VVGYDINPTAVLAARANYLIALGDLLRSVEGVEIPVVLCDSIRDGPPPQRPAEPSFDTIAGNPPWIAWDNLPADYRRATRPLWERYGLFSLSGNEGRHGGAKKDLAMLMIYATADRYLKRGGRLGMVVTQTAFQTKGAGDGFRRFRLGPQGDWLKVLRVDDMAALRPFPGVANWTSTILLEKGEATRYPVPYFKWTKKTKKASELFSERENEKESAVASAENSSDPFFVYRAEPIEGGRPSSPWFLRPAGLQADLATLIGPSDYTAHLGANSGGANGVYWVTAIRRADGGVLVRNAVEKVKRHTAAAEHVIEPQLLYPLLRWGDVARYRAVPSAAILLAQDVTTRSGIEQAVIEREYPRAYAYLQGFEGLLLQRAAYRRYQGGKPFYSMYNVGPYTVAPIKVVWRRMDRRIRAAVVEEADDPLLGRRPVVPQETCVLIAIDSADAAHYVCAVLNSAIAGFLVAAHSVAGGKGFGTPGVLDFIRLRRFDPEDARHAELAALSRAAHAAGGVDVADIQCTIDRLAAELWGLEQEECAVIDREMKLHP
jgi:methylase of polypeptide subunit release factors